MEVLDSNGDGVPDLLVGAPAAAFAGGFAGATAGAFVGGPKGAFASALAGV